jgi:hypothetical protein
MPALGLPIPEAFGGVPVRQVRELQSYIKFLLYGKPGVGKTTLTAKDLPPEMLPALHMSTDLAESETLRHVAPDVYSLHVASFDQFWEIRKDAAKPTSPFQTIILDTSTEAQKLSMTDIMTALALNGRPSGGEVNIDVPSVREWGQSISEIRRLVRGFRDLPVNFIMTAHESESRDNRGVNWYKPDLPGKLANQVAGMFSTVAYLYVKTEEQKEGNRTVVTSEQRCLLTGFVNGYICKNRAGTLPRVMIEPSMAEIYRLLTTVREEPSAVEGGQEADVA